MSMLPINLEDLLNARTIESSRIEYKKTWNDPIEQSVVRTIAAFANDLQNLNGGYVILGVEEEDGRPLLPPHGLDDLNLDLVQKELRGACERLDPKYQPVLFVEKFQNRLILIAWAPAGDVRPYTAPESPKGQRQHFVRMGSQTIAAKGEIQRQLLELAGRVPFDDRRRPEVPLDKLSGELLRAFLADVHSGLLRASPPQSLEELARALKVTARTNGHECPRNIALLFFTDDPETFFPGCRLEIVQFGGALGDETLEEVVIRGPLHRQVRQAIDYVNGISSKVIQKLPGRAEASHLVAFPYEALEETIANAVLHRGYDGPPEPIKIYLYPDRIEITSYPGPLPGLTPEHLSEGARPPPLPQRNRRIGDFLKELRLAEMRNTGIPTIRRTMRENGSPAPIFDFDEARTYFRVTLPAHPEYLVLQGMREASRIWTLGDRSGAVAALRALGRVAPANPALAAQLIEYLAASGELPQAKQIFLELEAKGSAPASLYLALARALLDQRQDGEARELLRRTPSVEAGESQLELAILQRRSNRLQDAHKTFERALETLANHPKAVHEFAQTKLALARTARGPHRHSTQAILFREAKELLRRVISLTEDRTRQAWAWYDLARALHGLKESSSSVRQAITNAIQLLPGEPRFIQWREQFFPSSSTSADDSPAS